jgi:O-succinylbenzoate synthase
MMEAVRNSFPDLVMHIDCNSGFTLDDLDLFRKLDGLNLRMIEQPLAYNDLIDHAKLQKELSTPICLDESISSPARAKKAIEVKACRWINIKTSRVGGLTNALQIQQLCSDNKIPVWVGGMLESATGQAPSIALATKGSMAYPCYIFTSKRFYTEDFSEPEIVHSGPGKINAPMEPGAGFTPKLSLLEKYASRAATL